MQGPSHPGVSTAPGEFPQWRDTRLSPAERVAPVAQVTRPVVRLIGYPRVPLEPGESAQVTFTVPADLTSFTGVNGRRVVKPGDVPDRELQPEVEVGPAPAQQAVAEVGQ